MIKVIFLNIFFLINFNALYSQIEVECDEFSYIIDSNLILVKKGINYGIIDSSGKIIMDYNIKSPEIYNNFLVNEKIKSQGLDGDTKVDIIDLKTFEVIWSGSISKIYFSNDEYICIYYFNHSNFTANSFVINKKGLKIFELPKNTNYNKIGETFLISENIMKVPIKDNKSSFSDYYIYLDINGNKIMDSTFIYAKDFHNGLAKTGIYKHGKLYWGFINSKGKTIIEHKFSNEPTSFSDSLARVKDTNGKYGYINIKGEIVISPQFSFATGFYKGLALVRSDYNSDFLLINKNGEIVKRYNTFRRINRNDNSDQQNLLIKELVNEKILKTDVSSTFIDFNGNLILNEKGLFVSEFNFGLAKFQKHNFQSNITIYGLINSKGKITMIKKSSQF